jgi:hypothetical protein
MVAAELSTGRNHGTAQIRASKSATARRTGIGNPDPQQQIVLASLQGTAKKKVERMAILIIDLGGYPGPIH